MLGDVAEWLLSGDVAEWLLSLHHAMDSPLPPTSLPESPIVSVDEDLLTIVSVPTSSSTTPVPSVDLPVLFPREFYHAPPVEVDAMYKDGLEDMGTFIAELLVRVGVIREALEHDTESFKRFEFLGDALLRSEMSEQMQFNPRIQHIAPDTFSAGVFHNWRVNSERKETLAILFDELGIVELVPIHPPGFLRSGFWKRKGDFIEAIIGELHVAINYTRFSEPLVAEHASKIRWLFEQLTTKSLLIGRYMKPEAELKRLQAQVKRRERTLSP